MRFRGREIWLAGYGVVLACTLMQAADGPFTQQGPKLVGTGETGFAHQGTSVALSADGNTAIVGGYSDNGQAGAVWVWTRTAGVWTQQGPKLVGTGAAGNALQGISVALSADGNTALTAGVGDEFGNGAVWVWTRSGGVWTQQGPKLVGTGAIGPSVTQGRSLALSADGNTALIGGPQDNGIDGAVWVWTRSGGVWSQQGPKLVGTGAVDVGSQGSSVALSADGNTALVGGLGDNTGRGAVWVWTRSGGVWTQQGPKLVGTGALGSATQGGAVALSADGNTALVAGQRDDEFHGAVWIWTRSGGVWTQQGPKLIGTGAVDRAAQGSSVALSADGNTALVAGLGDNSDAGAAWVWKRSGGVWTQQGAKFIGMGSNGNAYQGNSVALSANGDTALVGGPLDNGGDGAAWVFTAPATCSSRALRTTSWSACNPPRTGKSYATYRADLVNPGTALASARATLRSLDPFSIRAVPGQDYLSFGPAPNNGQVTSGNTFSIIVDPNVPVDFTKLEWTFETAPAAPFADAGPDRAVIAASTVMLDARGSTNPSGTGTLTYSWKFTSRPPGTRTVLFWETSITPMFVADVPGTYVLTLTVSNSVGSSSANVTITVQ